MPSIQVTFPTDLKKEVIKDIFEDNMKRAGQGHTCKVKYLKMFQGEYLFKITTDKAQGFYFIGMVACSIMKALEDIKNKPYSPIDIPEPKSDTVYFKDN